MNHELLPPASSIHTCLPCAEGVVVKGRFPEFISLSKLIKASGVKWETNIMRHSFGSYHYGLYNDSLSTSQQLGHKTGDNILFSHYRNLVSYEDSKAYFEITDVNN